jgi:hypothetical protein
MLSLEFPGGCSPMARVFGRAIDTAQQFDFVACAHGTQLLFELRIVSDDVVDRSPAATEQCRSCSDTTASRDQPDELLAG